MSVKDEKAKIYAAFIAYTICIVCTRMTRRRKKDPHKFFFTKSAKYPNEAIITKQNKTKYKIKHRTNEK